MYRSGTALLIKLRHCFISITAKNKIQKTTLSCVILVIMTITKPDLSKTKYLALLSMKPFQSQKEFLLFRIIVTPLNFKFYKHDTRVLKYHQRVTVKSKLCAISYFCSGCTIYLRRLSLPKSSFWDPPLATRPINIK